MVWALSIPSAGWAENAVLRPRIDVRSRTETTRKEPSLWAVRTSLAVHAVGSAMDGWSSWRMPEGNGILRSGDGRFGAQGLAMKASLFGGTAVLTELLARRTPRSRRALTIVNYAVGGIYGSLATRNVVMQRRWGIR